MRDEALKGPAEGGTFASGEFPFRQLLEKLPVGAYTCDAAGLITYFNPQAVQIWGRAPRLNDSIDRFCGSFKLYAADGAPIPHDDCWMARALRTGEEYNGAEIVIEREDGGRLTVLAHANPLRDESGKVVGAVNVLVDITDRKKAEVVQARLAAIVESSEDAIVAKSLEGRIQSWNSGAERLFGYTAAEAIGAPITLIVPPELREEEFAILARLRQGERIEHFETERVSKHGHRIDVSLSISPIRDGAGRIVGASKVARDISERKRGEQAILALKDELAVQLGDLRRLHGMSRRLSTTLELHPILEETLRVAAAIQGTDLAMLSLCDPHENDLKVKASLGFHESFLKDVSRISPEGGACGICFLEQRRVVVEDVEIDPLLAQYRKLARQAGFRAVHSTPLVTRSGKVVGVLSTYFRRPRRPSDREMHLIDLCVRQAVDFIENARLYAELREADQRKDEFLATLAHELRNPLAPISNALEILNLSENLDPVAGRVLEIVGRQVKHLIRLVDDLLEVSRISRGKIELRREPLELAAIVRSAVETSRPLIDRAGHQLAIMLSPESIRVEVDPVRISQVIANLLNNAAKYTPEGGQIWLSARRELGEAVISVRDNGMGIPTKMLPRVFDMFAQADRTLDRAQGGLGIGLSLARNLVQMHGGRIEASSKGPGCGSEFVVRLPLTQSVPTPTVAAPRRAAFPPRRVLVVDDARAAVFTLGKLLEAMGQRVRTAHDAATALEIVRSDPPDVVISDIAMPEMNGYELARRLRKECGPVEPVLVALTGYGQDSDRQRSIEAGFDYHLVKPVSSEALEKLLASLPASAAEIDSSDGA